MERLAAELARVRQREAGGDIRHGTDIRHGFDIIGVVRGTSTAWSTRVVARIFVSAIHSRIASESVRTRQ